MHLRLPIAAGAIFILIGLGVSVRILDEGFSSREVSSVMPKDIRLDAPGYSMAHVSIRNQGPFGDCYAEVAAEMVDAYRFSHGDTNYAFQTSGLALAAKARNTQNSQYAQTQPSLVNPILDSGYPCFTFSEIPHVGVCNDAALRLRDGTSLETYATEFLAWQQSISALVSFENELEQIRQNYAKENSAQAQQPAKGLMSIPDFISQVATQIQNLYSALSATQYVQKLELGGIDSFLDATQIVDDLVQGGYPVQSLSSVLQIQNQLLQNQPVALLATIVQNDCTGQNVLYPKVPACDDDVLVPTSPLSPSSDSPINWAAIGETWGAKYGAVVNQMLDQPNPQPVGLGICDAVLSSSNGATWNSGVPWFGPASAYCTGKHSVVVIGRRTNPKTGKTDFLVRDSRDLACPGPYYASAWECVGPSELWVDADRLLQNTYIISSLQ